MTERSARVVRSCVRSTSSTEVAENNPRLWLGALGVLGGVRRAQVVCLVAAALVLGAGLAACRRAAGSPPPLRSLLPQTTGTLALADLTAPVRIVRDEWGVPHIYAETQADLFTAQGFVQAQDRLFQMDLWRRSVQGRLSEVLGANFIERDA